MSVAGPQQRKRLQVTSEIYAETDFNCSDQRDGSACNYRPLLSPLNFFVFFFLFNTESVSRFSFTYPPVDSTMCAVADKDGDLVVERQRRKSGVIEIGLRYTNNNILIRSEYF